MPVERSAGIIVFKNTPEGRRYLVLRSRRHSQSSRPEFWDFPKGLLEKGETGLEAAKREVKEEAGLEIEEVLPDFKETVNYFTKWQGKTIPKFAVLFLAKVGDEKIELSEEHDEFQWLSFKEARERLSNQVMKKALEKADEFLQKSS